MQIIDFSYNWNRKLDCDAFTTIRLHNPDKYVKDRNYEIKLKGVHQCYARSVDVRSFTIDQLNEWRAMLDTGYSLIETQEVLQKMYKNRKINWATQKLDILLLSRAKSRRR